ncbi:hypothetical protein NARC_10244 [Candidatus Nitrosocosmicus arcticus]|uniref:Uncharacterized protein n=1 Tax=Candidatus Nitrosocosmicus arcticus TaxID=2035267 RepID=A0A557SZ13_9ARCH|nr:hypothetical protein NARC_10244 [Candidatus Nitrosocosmicus arcticus]
MYSTLIVSPRIYATIDRIFGQPIKQTTLDLLSNNTHSIIFSLCILSHKIFDFQIENSTIQKISVHI